VDRADRRGNGLEEFLDVNFLRAVEILDFQHG
jgi:hypothetical protein